MKTTISLSAFFLFTVLSSYGQWEYTNLSEAKGQMGVAALGSKVYFAGGFSFGLGGIPLDKIDIYDVGTGEWTYGTLSEARILPVGVTCGSKVFFAGGAIFPSIFFSEVDIFDTVTGQWSVEYLSEPRFALSAVSKGNKVLFAGGANLALNEAYNVVDIYDTETGLWDINYLSQPRGNMGTAVVGDLAIFAGGYDNLLTSDRVDIYNFTTGVWDTATLTQSRGFVSATTIGNKVLIAGGFRDGFVPSSRVDIYDATTNTWLPPAELSVPRCSENVFRTVCGKSFYVGGGSFNGQSFDNCSDVIDVYDSLANTWSVDYLTAPLVWHSVVAVGDKLLVAGGQTGSGSSWFDQDLISIYTNPDCIPQSIDSYQGKEDLMKVYPNPGSSNLHLEMPNDNLQKSLLATIYNLQGQQVFTQLMEPGNKDLTVTLVDGLYLLKVVSEDATHTKLITIQK